MRTTRDRIHRVGLFLTFAGAAFAPAMPAMAAAQFTSDFSIERCKFEPNGRQNPYFSLNPGDQVTLEGEEDGEAVKVEITVEGATRRIDFTTPKGTAMSILARVIVEKEWHDGALIEISHNWFSRCRQTHDVFYFGEAVDLYENGAVTGHDGSWEAGVSGAQPGIAMPARFLLGSRYIQEQAPGVAVDQSEHVGMGLTMRLAGKTLKDCVAVAETTPLEPGSVGDKAYCPGVGLVLDGTAILTGYRRDQSGRD